MKRLILAAALTLGCWGQAKEVIRYYTYGGAPTAGDCDAAAEVGNRIAVNTSGATDLIYDCIEASGVVAWTVRGGGGTVTSVGWTGGIVSIATPTSTPAFTIAGTSGGVPYFSSATAWASSTAPAAGQLMVWGGAGAAPTGVVSTTYQPLDTELTELAGLSKTRGNLIRGGAAAWEVVALGATGGLLSSDGTDAVWLARVSASSAIDFASINDGACIENTYALTGAVVGDHIATGVSGTVLPAGVSATTRVSAADTAQIQVCNLSGAAVDLTSRTYSARVVR
jgi:hypothetical protein